MQSQIRFVDEIRGVFIADPNGYSPTRAILELADGAYEFILLPASNPAAIAVVERKEVHIPAAQPCSPGVSPGLLSLGALLLVAITTVNSFVLASILLAVV